MKSERPKGLFEICGLPMVAWVVRAMREAGVERPIVVVGHQGDSIINALGDACDYVWQHEQHGTGHAALMAKDVLAGFDGPLFIAPADTPLITASVFQSLCDSQASNSVLATLATLNLSDPSGYGRIVRDAHGKVAGIVEERDANPRVKAIKEVNAGIYCFDCRTLLSILPTLSSENDQSEYYLTDVIATIHDRGGIIESRIVEDPVVLTGVNDRWQLAQVERLMRQRILKRLALSGVTVHNPETILVEADVVVGEDTELHAGVTLRGNTVIGSGCVIGPWSQVNDSVVGDGCTVLMSHLNKATMDAGSRCGPFAHLRPGSRLGSGAKVGNFVEVKNATLGANSAASHLTYLGDATIGPDANIGAGTITCNYDGFAKHRTEIGAGAFVGSNSTLVAPVTIGEGAFVAAGSTITSDVPAEALGIGRTRQENKESWAARWRALKKTAKL